jgi:peptidoglycan/LPS O-acetylase OafA/YrhL
LSISLISCWLVAFAATTRYSVLSARPLRWLGDISYSFYAYATPMMIVIALGVLIATPEAWRHSQVGSIALFWITLAATLAIVLPTSYASFRLLELPASRLASRFFDPLR